MPYWWWIVPVLTGLVGLAVLADGLAALGRRRPYRAMGELLSGGGLLAIAVTVMLLGLDIQTFSRLAYERPVATISLHQTGDKQYEATLTEADRVPPPFAIQATAPPAPQTYPLTGDEWRVEARVLKWKPWANVMGMDARYRLERLSGEFIDAAQELSGPRSVYDLRPANGDSRLTRLAVRLNQARLVDTLYGSAVLMPMADDARYSLAMTQTGLMARPANDQAARAVGGWK
jgi:hypothetical protein